MPYVDGGHQPGMTILTPEQLTGRVSTHVCENAALSCSLDQRTAEAALALKRTAATYDIDLRIASGFRDFERQRLIWNGKFRGERALLDRRGQPLDVRQMDEESTVRAILQWSALPGASRHHWGSELDVYDGAALAPGALPRLTPSEYVANGVFARLTAFLAEHAPRHGFFLPYDSERGGVQPEPWHLSYAPIAGAALPALTLTVLRDALRDVELAGSAVVARLLPEIHERYVNRVAPAPLTPAARPS